MAPAGLTLALFSLAKCREQRGGKNAANSPVYPTQLSAREGENEGEPCVRNMDIQ